MATWSSSATPGPALTQGRLARHNTQAQPQSQRVIFFKKTARRRFAHSALLTSAHSPKPKHRKKYRQTNQRPLTEGRHWCGNSNHWRVRRSHYRQSNKHRVIDIACHWIIVARSLRGRAAVVVSHREADARIAKSGGPLCPDRLNNLTLASAAAGSVSEAVIAPPLWQPWALKPISP